MSRSNHVKLGAGLALVLLSAMPAYACGWWDCRDGYGYRKPAQVYGYYSAGPAFRPMRAREVVGVPPAGDNFGLRGPYLSSAGIMASAMPARGPTLFGPDVTTSYGYTSFPQGPRQPRRLLRSR